MYSKLKTNPDMGLKIKNLSNPSGTISSNAFKQHLQDKGVHPDVISTLDGAGFFDKLVKGIKTTADFVIKNKDDIAKGIKTGVQVYNKGKEMYNTYKGGKMMAGQLKSNPKGGTILAGKLNTEHRKKINKVGQYMKNGYSMKEAWEMVKKE